MGGAYQEVTAAVKKLCAYLHNIPTENGAKERRLDIGPSFVSQKDHSAENICCQEQHQAYADKGVAL